MSEFEDLLSEYWDAAYAEGIEGRDHDTMDARAQRALLALQEHYAALLARHNALVDAMTWERECEWMNGLITEVYACVSEIAPEEEEISASYIEARAEVDRLIANESTADCKGEG